MNSITLEELNNVVPILGSNNVQPDDLFDYFRIVSLKNKKYENDAKNPLYILSYITEKDVKAGWFEKAFDLRTNFNEIMSKYPHATFVIESNMVDKVENKDAKYIVVDNINDFIDKLFVYFKNKSEFKTVAVTGTVGKTTSVGLIESVLQQKYKVLRIYSKRITPIVLKSNIINFLTEDVDIVVLENAIFYRDHVKVLASLLPPDIGCILNIESDHLDIGDLKDLDDICINKAEILRYAQLGFINKKNEYLDKLDISDGILEYQHDPLFPQKELSLYKFDIDQIKVVDNKFIIDDDIEIQPFFLSELSKVQYSIAYLVGKSLGLSKEELLNGLNNCSPVENRLQSMVVHNKNIIFDADITKYERLEEVSKNYYTNKYLVLRKIGSSEEIGRIIEIGELFNKFDKVFIFDDIEYFDILSKYPNVIVVNNHDFMNDLSGTIYYHYSGYYRVWDEFKEENLQIYDREKYPIKKRLEKK